MADVRIEKKAKDYIKKLKDKKLKEIIRNHILNIAEDPYVGELKKGNLSSVYGYDFRYSNTSYRIAYTLEVDDVGNVVIVVMIDTRENFWDKFTRYWG